LNTDKKVLAAFYDIINESKQNMFDEIAEKRTRYLTVVLENIYQEHNASAVMRSCDCFGIQDLHAIEKDNQYQVQRDIARGAGNWVDLYNYDKGPSPTLDCIQKLKDKGYKIVATTPHEKSTTVHDIAIDQPIALIFGTELSGISQDIIDHADAFISIPMYGFTESFNVSVSAALALNVLRERLQKSELDWKLSHEDQTALKIKWCTKIVKNGKEVELELRRRILEIE
jgi:tRNA (guanosine-2'-O-)-methyltransferase